MHPLHDISPGDNAPERINCLIEIPKGSRNKYELNKENGLFELSRTLYSPMIYPGDYGLIPQTHYDDGDPLDVIVMVNEPTFTGCLIEARPIGIFRMLDKGEADDKILCVPCHNPYFGNIHDLEDVPPHFLIEVAHFFAVYKDLEGSRTLSLGWENASVAHRQIKRSIDLYKEHFRDEILEREEVERERLAMVERAKKRSSRTAAPKAPARSAAPRKPASRKAAKKAASKKASKKSAKGRGRR